jgi:hypothetical protein
MPETNWLLTGGVQVVACAAFAGIVSMLVYRCVSPQQRLKQIESEAVAARRALNDLDGSFEDAWPLMRRSLGLALARLRLVLLPSILAGLPVLLPMALMEDRLTAPLTSFGPAWMQAGWIAFLAVTTVAALSTKIALRIK